ncbi:MAG: hypothetical protein K8R41_11595 [Bacteroidales bacterium]|nr:hypothetical protein [Bacteroidales bacterium]
MKKIMYTLVGLLLTSTIIAQDNYQQEIICPCMIEFEFPKSLEEKGKMLQAFGGIPVLRFEKAKIEGTKLICEYEKAFAKFFFDGFGFAIFEDDVNEGDFSSIPYEITLTLLDSFLHGWTPSRNSVKLQHYHRGCVVFALDFCDTHMVWNGGFYKSEYDGKRITLMQNFDKEAKVNSYGTGFIISDTKTGLYTPALNTDKISNPVIKGKKKVPPKQKENPPIKRKR